MVSTKKVSNDRYGLAAGEAAGLPFIFLTV
jgi:hypothetical protein